MAKVRLLRVVLTILTRVRLVQYHREREAAGVSALTSSVKQARNGRATVRTRHDRDKQVARR